METTTVQGTLREMWQTRPARPRDGRQVAGVAAAVARRYDVDPVLVRIGFVVAAFFGVGVAFYIAGWILLPETASEPHAPPVSNRWPRRLVVLGFAIAVAVTLGMAFGHDRWDGGVILPALAVVVLLFLLHRSRADRVAAVAPTQVAATVSGATDVLPTAPGDHVQLTKSRPEPVPVPRRPPVTSVTIGVALLAAGVTALIMLLAGVLSSATVPVLLGVALTVLGIGLVAGAFVRAGRGLIPIALLLSALTWAVVAGPPEGWRDGFGDLSVAPTTVAALQPTYDRAAGDIRLDLRGLDLAVPAGATAAPVRSSISLGVGDVEVLLPPDADLRLTASSGIGEVFYGPRAGNLPASSLGIANDLGADGVQSGRLLVLDIETGAGDVEVRRG